MTRFLLNLFLLVSAGEIISTLIEIPLLHFVCKPALLPILGLYYCTSIREQHGELSIAVLLAVLFSWAGDVLLMFQQNGELFFMLGLISFLTAHVFYIFAYRQHQSGDDSKTLKGLQRIRFGFPIVFAGFGLLSILYKHLGPLQIPVIIYAGVLTIMALVALFRYGKTTTSSFSFVFAGAILFMMSDSLLAINKFLEPLPFEGFWIMITYIGAQYFIVRGLLKHQ
jgi:uncharacterized membrane protein YhhN